MLIIDEFSFVHENFVLKIVVVIVNHGLIRRCWFILILCRFGHVFLQAQYFVIYRLFMILSIEMLIFWVQSFILGGHFEICMLIGKIWLIFVWFVGFLLNIPVLFSFFKNDADSVSSELVLVSKVDDSFKVKIEQDLLFRYHVIKTLFLVLNLVGLRIIFVFFCKIWFSLDN